MTGQTLAKKENGRSVLFARPGAGRCESRLHLLLDSNARVFLGLAVATVVARALLVWIPPQLALADQARMLAWSQLLLVLPLAWLGMRLAPVVGLAPPLGGAIPSKQRFVWPALVGAAANAPPGPAPTAAATPGSACPTASRPMAAAAWGG